MTDQDPQSTEVKQVLERGFGAEPPVGLHRDDLIARGKRRLRQQRTAAISGVALAAVAVLTVVSATTSWFTSPSSGPATVASRPTSTPVTPKPKPPRERLGQALRTAPIKWPAQITGRSNDPGPHWYDFRYGFLPSVDSTGYEANIKLQTPEGYRWLTIDVLTVPDSTRAPDCLGAQSKQPLPDCTRTTFPDGSSMRVDVEAPDDHDFPTIVLVTFVHPDHTQVEVMETSSVGNGARAAQLMPTTALTQIAQLPGFSLG